MIHRRTEHIFLAAVLGRALLPGAAQSVEFRVTERLTVQQGLEVSTSATATPLLFISSTTGAGNVGIGTTSPGSTLHVLKGPTAGATSFPAGKWAGQLFNGIDAANEGGLVVAARWAAPASTAMLVGGLYDGGNGFDTFLKVDGSGNVGIGTTSPGAKLHVSGGDLKVDGSRIIRKINVQTDSVTRTFTAWAVGMTFATIPGFKAGSLVRLTYHIPMRNDGAGWGGGYTEPQISFDGGTTWNSLGSSGYDGGVMCLGSGDCIGSYNNSILIDPAQGADFSVTVRFYHKAYDQTLTVNGSHDVNAVSGTATIMPGVNGLQHWTSAIVEELY